MVKKGRPLKNGNMNIRYTVRMDEGDDKKVNEYCEKTGKSKSDVIREAIRRIVK